MRGSLLASVVVLTVVLCGRGASADDAGTAAKAFSQGQAAMLEGEAAKAAEFFELADSMAPSAPALRNAARARMTAGHKAMAATHAAELLRRYHSDPDARAVAEALLSELAPELARIDVTCSEKCTVLVDGKVVAYSARDEHSFFVQPGDREVVAEFDEGRKASSVVTAAVNEVSAVTLEAPPEEVKPVIEERPPPPPLPATNKKIGRGWFVAGAIVTVGLGAAATLSGLQTLDTRDEIKALVEAGQQTEAIDLYNKGSDQQIRTNVLLGTSVAAGAITIVLAIFTNWSGTSEEPESPTVGVTAISQGMTITYGSRF